ncbi:uncharacterized protein LOC131264483 [Anopheles coustani]|uniref:uncharacterized protein LOC131264483 n=1 Tax=Anopheles coustani TaxID=139045 RepID=UPI00265AED80|nr:uncharacterized protein LOC131264483 [Anopheles coustani]
MRQFIDYGFNNKGRKVSALLVLTVVERLLLVEAMISETRQDIQAKIMLESQGRPIFPVTVSTRDELYAMMMQTLCSPQDAADPVIQDEQQARKQVYSMVARYMQCLRFCCIRVRRGRLSCLQARRFLEHAKKLFQKNC